MDVLLRINCQYMTWGALDNRRLLVDGALDLEFFAFALKLFEDADANMAVEVTQGPVSQARACGSIVLRDGAHAGTSAAYVTELRMAAFASAESAKLYDSLSARTPQPSLTGAATPASFNSSHRYVFHMQSLHDILMSDTRFEMPMLSVHPNGSLRPMVCMEDITAAPNAACVAVLTRNNVERLKKRTDIPAMIHVVVRCGNFLPASSSRICFVLLLFASP